MITVTKCFDFCYGHRLPDYRGPCASFHGHNARVEVEVTGQHVGGYSGMVVDFRELKKAVGPVIDLLDHSDLTHQFQGVPATAETICEWLARQIQTRLPDGVELVRLRVSETPDSWAEWKENCQCKSE